MRSEHVSGYLSTLADIPLADIVPDCGLYQSSPRAKHDCRCRSAAPRAPRLAAAGSARCPLVPRQFYSIAVRSENSNAVADEKRKE